MAHSYDFSHSLLNGNANNAIYKLSLLVSMYALSRRSSRTRSKEGWAVLAGYGVSGVNNLVTSPNDLSLGHLDTLHFEELGTMSPRIISHPVDKTNCEWIPAGSRYLRRMLDSACTRRASTFLLIRVTSRWNQFAKPKTLAYG